MEPQEILEKLFDEKKFRLLKFFFKYPESEFHLREIASETKIPVATTFRLVHKFQELDLVKETKLKKFRTYSLNQTKATELLHEIISQKKTALNEFVDILSTIEEVKQVILHGKEEKNKANVIIIGDEIPVDQIKKAVAYIKETYDFTIIELTSGQEQFLKMSEMGLFSGKRTTLYQK